MTEPIPTNQIDSHKLLQTRTATGSAADMRRQLVEQGDELIRQAKELAELTAEHQALITEFSEVRRRLHVFMVRSSNALEALNTQGQIHAGVAMARSELQDAREGR